MRIFNRIRRKLLAELEIKNYTLYALGEILLIVVGILIALQINNWNDGRKVKLEEVKILNNLQDYFIANEKQIEHSRKEIEQNREVLILRILHTGPEVELPNQAVLDSISKFKFESLKLVYGGTGQYLTPDKVTILENQALKDELNYFAIACSNYQDFEKSVEDLTYKLRVIHQEYISILTIESEHEGGVKSNQTYFPSDFLGWLRDRRHQNRAIESKWHHEQSLGKIDKLKAHNSRILSLLKEELEKYKG